MPLATGYEQGHYVCVRLAEDGRGALNSLARHGLNAARSLLDNDAEALGVKADDISQSFLRKLLEDSRTAEIRPLLRKYSAEAGKASPSSMISSLGSAFDELTTITDIRSFDLLFDKKISKAFQRQIILKFKSSDEAKKALREFARDLLVESAHAPQLRTHCAEPLESSQWGLAEVGALSTTHSTSVDEVVIGVIDSGVDSQHPDLAGEFDQLIHARLFHPDHDSGGGDDDGHGTHCIGTIIAKRFNNTGIRGLCRPKELYSYRVFSPFDSLGYYNALRQAIEDKVDVLNLSLAGNEDLTETELIQEAVDSGMVVCAAAGNDRGLNSADAVDRGLDEVDVASGYIKRYPAALSEVIPGVIAVGAAARSLSSPAPLEVASYSNFGSHIDVIAPGSDIISTVPGGAYDVMSGTSMATPFVVAIAAMWRQLDPSLSPMEIREKIRSTARPVGSEFGRNDRSGYGFVTFP